VIVVTAEGLADRNDAEALKGAGVRVTLCFPDA
jgi:ribosomal 30S subunit maturation factor RimM